MGEARQGESDVTKVNGQSRRQTMGWDCHRQDVGSVSKSPCTRAEGERSEPEANVQQVGHSHSMNMLTVS